MPVFFHAPEALLGARALRRLESPGSALLLLGRSYGYVAAHRALIQTIPTRRCTPRAEQRFLRPGDSRREAPLRTEPMARRCFRLDVAMANATARRALIPAIPFHSPVTSNPQRNHLAW